METKGSSKALLEAVRSGRAAFARFLLWTGVSVNARDSRGRTALHVACQTSHEDMQSVIDVLLRSGVEVDARDEDATTPLHEACANMNQKAVIALLKHGAKVELVDSFGMTVLHIVASNNSPNSVPIIRALLSNYKSASHYQPGDEEILRVLNLQDKNGDTALHLASERKDSEIVRLLLRLGAKVGVRNSRGQTALHYAGRVFCHDIIDVLVDNGEDVNAKDFDGNTPLHATCLPVYYGCLTKDIGKTIEKLLVEGAKVNERNKRLETPYYCTVRAFYCSNDHVRHCSFCKGERKKIDETFIKHFMKLKSLSLQDGFDVEWEMGLGFYDEIKNKCSQELDDMKSKSVVSDISLYEVLSRTHHSYLLSSDDILHIYDFLCSPDLLIRFPLYGDSLRAAFHRPKLLTLAVQSFYAEQRKQMVKELPCEVTEQLLTYLTNEDLRNFIRSEQYEELKDFTYYKKTS